MNYEYEIFRLATFHNWASYDRASPTFLAKAGFIYNGESDVVSCFSCHVSKRGWNRSLNPEQVHRELSPWCQFVGRQHGINIPILVPEQDEYKRILDELRDGSATSHLQERSTAQSTGAGFRHETSPLSTPPSVLQILGVMHDPDLPSSKLEEIAHQIENMGGDEASAVARAPPNGDRCKPSRLGLAEENRALRRRWVCKICCGNPVSIVSLPCGHLVCCAACHSNLRRCPVCGGVIWAWVKTKTCN